jgi:hypothetical protein
LKKYKQCDSLCLLSAQAISANQLVTSQTFLECRAAALSPLKPYYFDSLLDGDLHDEEHSFSSFAAQLNAEGQMEGNQASFTQAPICVSRSTVKAELTQQLMGLLKMDVDHLTKAFR